MAWNDSNTIHYVLPENVPANEFLNFEGQKFPKAVDGNYSSRISEILFSGYAAVCSCCQPA